MVTPTYKTLEAALIGLDDARATMICRADLEMWKAKQDALLDAVEKLLGSHGALALYVYPFPGQQVSPPDEINIMQLRSDIIDLISIMRPGYTAPGHQPKEWVKWAEQLTDIASKHKE